jgi:hypothetical protein
MFLDSKFHPFHDASGMDSNLNFPVLPMYQTEHATLIILSFWTRAAFSAKSVPFTFHCKRNILVIIDNNSYPKFDRKAREVAIVDVTYFRF